MRAVIRVEVENRKQARDIEAGLSRPDVRAFALVMGVLETLPSKRGTDPGPAICLGSLQRS